MGLAAPGPKARRRYFLWEGTCNQRAMRWMFPVSRTAYWIDCTGSCCVPSVGFALGICVTPQPQFQSPRHCLIRFRDHKLHNTVAVKWQVHACSAADFQSFD